MLTKFGIYPFFFALSNICKLCMFFNWFPTKLNFQTTFLFRNIKMYTQKLSKKKVFTEITIFFKHQTCLGTNQGVTNHKSQGAEILREVHPDNMLHVMCHVSCVMCHVSCVTCHVSHVTCHMSCVTCIFSSSF